MQASIMMEETYKEAMQESTLITLLLNKIEKNMLESIGFVFKDEIHAEMPNGWSLKNDGQVTIFIDEKGNKRGTITKCNSNGRIRTFVNLIRRYIPIFQFSEDNQHISGCIKDNCTGKIIHKIWSGKRDFYNPFEISEGMHEYLNQHYPKWEDYNAYWY